MTPALQPPPSAMALFLVFMRIGLTSFGGGLSGWMLREFVQRRAWLDEEEFLTGLALAQAFPGVNVVNIAIWIGYRFHGTWGAVAGFGGIVVPPAVVVVIIAAGFAALTRYPVTHLVLDGIGAAAIGLSLKMGIVAGRRVFQKGVWPTILMLLAFIGVGVLHLSLPLVVVVLGVIGVALAYWDLARA
jgi:chromate transporter